jgi:hypothetical protein
MKIPKILYTRGPWRWWNRKSGRPEKYDLAKLITGDTDQSGKTVLCLYGGEGHKALGKTKQEIGNARLLEVTPDLFEAFMLAHAFLDSLPEGWLARTSGDVGALNVFYIKSGAIISQLRSKAKY